MNPVRAVLSAAIFLALALPSSVVFAHPGHGVPGHGLGEGLLHPLLGWDHLIAMVAVGLLAAQLGGRALWAVPCSFVVSMVGGGVIGMMAWNVAAVEYGIAASIIVLGLGVAWNGRFRLALPLLLAALFGIFHGHAHGAEMPSITSPALFACGFFAATIALHAAGILVGRMALHSARGAAGLRVSGGAIAVAGVCWVLLL